MILALVFLSCGPAKKGPQPNETYFWKVTKSDLVFGSCSDATDFRASITPITITDNSYFVYKVAADGLTAVSQSCTSLDVKTCKTPDAPVTFQIAGTELTFLQDRKVLIDTTTCNLQQSETWTLRDMASTFTLDIDNVLALTDSTTDCDKVEANLKTRSPNMLGVVGCVVSYKLSGQNR